MTDSLCLARDFSKRHDNVLRAYDNLNCSAEFNRLNFEPVEYQDHKGELRRMVKMTKDGFMMLVHIELSSTPNGTKIKMSVRVNLMQQQVRS